MSAADIQDTGKRKRAPVVLVVEDDLTCRDALGETLKDAGYVVLEAGDGEHALRMLLDDDMPEPMAIVLDLWLPIMSGPELLKVLRGYHRLSRIPVILTSAGPPYRAETGGEAAWLPRPFEAERLLALVASCCAATDAPASSEKIAG